ncbi:PE domain-containing protein [Nocardia huaxiensis]|uniref:PE domain-containing protein n=1 Tax=Nocardia huaxiensis TaxID=2755382 RepID=A0A7D6ZEP4_9NOCA|nr:PE domain-containing protein [Nocardia huaxiensis]QLY31858.1 PE domain-containing protein [Nocardia huaxiensis]UFS95422.1 PE domain-containing protein [Nocardia huaxiensis]
MTSGDTTFAGVQFDSKAATDAAVALDVLADRLLAELRSGEPALTVAPAGLDEVSVRAAQTMTDVARDFLAGAGDAVFEMRKLAAALRNHVVRVAADEEESAGAFDAVTASVAV